MNATTLSALAEPNRLRIVEYLRDGPRSVGDISRQLAIRQPQVSKHLRVLSEAGFVQVQPLANLRVYQLQPEPFEELDGWLGSFRQLWEKRLEVLDEYLQEMKKKKRTENGEQ